MEELWIPVRDWEGWYEVSSKGRLRLSKRIIETSFGKKRELPAKLIKAPSSGVVLLKRSGKKQYVNLKEVVRVSFSNDSTHKELDSLDAKHKELDSWDAKYQELLKFVNNNPTRWPSYDRRNTKSLESRLSVFCQTLRQKFRNDELSQSWIDKLERIDFNFNGKSDNWIRRYEEVKNTIGEVKSISVNDIGERNYAWLKSQTKKAEANELSDERTLLILKLNIEQYKTSWDDVFIELQDWFLKNGRLPKKREESYLFNWIRTQRTNFRNGRLSDDQKVKLESININLAPPKDKSKVWIDTFNQVKRYISLNESWPRFRSDDKEEERLSSWCQYQRNRYHKRLGNYNELERWKINKLNSINFKWSSEETFKEAFEKKIEELKAYKTHHGNLSSLSTQDVPLYGWLSRQKKKFSAGEMTLEEANVLGLLGVKLEDID